MSTDRPTFNESWYRVASLKPRLRANAQTYRQHFRAQTWYVVQDRTNNQYFRLSDPAYHFVAMLDGRLTVDEVWKACADQLGDDAPTQGEAINVLGQLFASNLLQSDLPADAASMFERFKKRRQREVRGYIQNIMFARIPLFDPNYILDRWVRVFGWLFGPVGFVLWAVLVGTGMVYAFGDFDKLVAAADPQLMLRTENLVLLYLSFAIIKAIHEFGHGFACKRYGIQNGSGGDVHVMGIMLLVFTPVPYVDASSSWAFRNKWHRAFVGAAGMYIELAVAAVAAIVWAHSEDGTLTQAITYNMMFIASVSTLLFNANPLLRFDGYYILSDLLELPNLSQRSKDYLYYLVKKYTFGVKRAKSSIRAAGERFWFVLYGIASLIYRVFISVGIILFVADKLFFIGVIMALLAVSTWLFVPLGKFIKYLATDNELARTRRRAVALTVIFFAALIGGLGGVPVPDHARIEGVIEPRRLSIVYAEQDGFVDRVTPSGERVSPGGRALIATSNPMLEAELSQLKVDRDALVLRRDIAQVAEPAAAQSLTQSINALDEQIRETRRRLKMLDITPTIDGVWVSPEVDRLPGAFLQQGQELGMVVSSDDLFVRAIADQAIGPRIGSSETAEIPLGTKVEMRIKGRPQALRLARIEKVLNAGVEQLPSAALGYLAGGETQVSMEDQTGMKTAKPVFEVHLALEPAEGVNGEAEAPSALGLLSGQRVVIRLESPPKPLLAQWWRALRQMVQERFRV